MKTAADIEVLDCFVDELTRRQFAILVHIACGKGRQEVMDLVQIDRITLQAEVGQIKNVFEAVDMAEAVERYIVWIEAFESDLKEQRGF